MSYIYILVILEVYFLTLKKYLCTNIDSIKDKSELQRLEWKQYKKFFKPMTTTLIDF